MFLPHSGPDGWAVLPDECTEVLLRQDCLDELLTTIQRLREILARVPLSPVERQALLAQLWRMQHYLREPVDRLLADHLLRSN